MISPHTKPGTDVVAVCDVEPQHGLSLRKGVIYTVDRVERALPGEPEDFVVLLCGMRGCDERRFFPNFWRKEIRRLGFSLSCFRYLELCGLEALLDVRVKERQ